MATSTPASVNIFMVELMSLGLAANEMRLEADTVQGVSSSEQFIGEIKHSHRLVVGRLDIVVVDVQLDIGSGGMDIVELAREGMSRWSLPGNRIGKLTAIPR